MYRRPDDEAANRDRAAEAQELEAFGRRVRVPRSRRRLVLTIVLVLGGLFFVAGAGIIAFLWLIADALPHGDPSCIQTMPDGSVVFDRGCVNGQRIPRVPGPPAATDGG